jgi:RNA polymerase subunit RPABC4/transcription elongation factor Spt4
MLDRSRYITTWRTYLLACEACGKCHELQSSEAWNHTCIVADVDTSQRCS